MKRSQINAAIADARLVFERHHWHLPPRPRWDVTGFGLEQFDRMGLVLVNLAELPQYCEKLLFAKARQLTIMHAHRKKQEDIIARVGAFAMRLANHDSEFRCDRNGPPVRVLLNGEERMVESNSVVYLRAGERITLFPGVYHEFWPVSEYCIMGEVSTANDDQNDNFFERDDVGRFEQIEEDEPPLERLLNEQD